MAKCHPRGNDVGSLILDHSSSSHHHHHHHTNNHHYRIWNSFSLRKLIIATVSCGGGGGSKTKHPTTTTTTKNNNDPKPHSIKPEPRPDGPGRADAGKLMDLLNLSSSSFASDRKDKVEVVAEGGVGEEKKKEEEEEDAEEMKRRKEERLEELRKAVKLLQSDNDVEERESGAKLVRGFGKEDSDARVTLAMLGAIPPLVAMLDNDDTHHSLIQALYALLNLGIGNDLNKAAIVQAGAVHKMLKKVETSDGSLKPTVSEAIVANFLALSALDSNKPVIGASGAIPFLVSTLVDSEEKSSSQARQDSLRALYNLSITPSNVTLILETDLVRYLISMLGDMDMSERILSILSNVVSVSEGRKAISSVSDSLSILIDVLNWTDSPGCQEKGSYILMVMAHKSYSDRQNMIEAGVGSALLELTLLGSTLAQKRASRILECLRVDKGKQISRSFVNGKTGSAVSAPICGSSSSTSNVNKEEEDMMMSEEKKAVKNLVQQSLQSNMKRIVKRANLPQDFVPSEHLKTLTVSSTSKSLPF